MVSNNYFLWILRHRASISSNRICLNGLYRFALSSLVDFICATVASYIFSICLKESTSTTDLDLLSLFFNMFYFTFTLLSYGTFRLAICVENEMTRDRWNKESNFMRTCFVINSFFPAMLCLFVLIHLIIFIIWIFQILLAFLWSLTILPQQYWSDTSDLMVLNQSSKTDAPSTKH